MSNILEIIKLAGCKEPQDNGDFWRTNAVWRGGEGYNVAFNKETGYWKDWVTQDHGTFAKFCELCGIKKEVSDNVERIVVIKEERIKFKTYDKECLTRLVPNNFYIRRGISEEVLKLFQCGLARTGKFYNRICFPIFDDNGFIIGFAGRKVEDESVRPKWLIHGPKKMFLYPRHLNEFLLEVKRKVVLVESVGDVLALWELGICHCLCLFGSDISPRLISYLLELSPETIIISTNNDIPGRASAVRIRKKLKKHFVEARIKTILPPGKDWAESLKKDLLLWKRNNLS